jgi:hypothetical protein
MLWSGSPLLPDEFLPVGRGGEIAQAGMSSLPVVEHLDVLADLGHGLLPVAILAVVNISRLSVPKKLSIGALFQQFPLRLIDGTILNCFISFW